jgi:hypothetical protein
MNFAEAIALLRNYDEPEVGGQHATLYVADPWEPESDASVEWSGAKGGVPLGRKPILLYLTTVRAALRFFGADYDDLIRDGEMAPMCRRLAAHVALRNAQGLPSET